MEGALNWKRRGTIIRHPIDAPTRSMKYTVPILASYRNMAMVMHIAARKKEMNKNNNCSPKTK
ncbi:MAG: hypothetical protein ACXACR_17570 [Candidatus Hodarchaeales archaeon]